MKIVIAGGSGFLGRHLGRRERDGDLDAVIARLADPRPAVGR